MKRFKISISGFILSFLYVLPIIPQSWRTVSRVIDGDTLELQGGENVRLIGIDTPEPDNLVQLVEAAEACGFLRGLTEGKKVRLEYDQNKTDMYDRTLAYLYLEALSFQD